MIRATLSVVAALLAGPALAGDASGFDPGQVDQCLAAATTQGARADCASAGMQACLDYAGRKYTGDDKDFPMRNCLDASHQDWEARLTDVYDKLLDAQGAKGIKPQEMLRQAERSWLQFREDLCHQQRDSAAATADGDADDPAAALAEARCIRDETARQAALLMTIGAQE